MKLSNHAKIKLEIYGISEGLIINELRLGFREFYDVREKTFIRMVEVGKILLAIVFDNQKEKIITVYRTDRKTIINRQKNKRWL